VDRILDLPIRPAKSKYDVGRRDYDNASRCYFDATNRAAFPVCDEVAKVFQSPVIIKGFEMLCGKTLDGAYLRIEYAQDTDGFWLEPHKDIREKLVSLLIYLSKEPTAADLGTDIYNEQGRHWVKRVPFRSNHALLFFPGDTTWHGFERRPFIGVRRTLIINYVTDSWRNRFELAYPDQPVRLTVCADQIQIART
jgi:hypothetical protein